MDLQKAPLIAGTILVATFLVSGCLPLAVGAGTGVAVAHAKGNLEVVVDGSPAELATAAEIAIDDLGMRVVSADLTEDGAEVIGETAGSKKIKIRARPQGDYASKLSIRIGTFGRRAMTHDLYAAILKQLKARQSSGGETVRLEEAPTAAPFATLER